MSFFIRHISECFCRSNETILRSLLVYTHASTSWIHCVTDYRLFGFSLKVVFVYSIVSRCKFSFYWLLQISNLRFDVCLCLSNWDNKKTYKIILIDLLCQVSYLQHHIAAFYQTTASLQWVVVIYTQTFRIYISIGARTKVCILVSVRKVFAHYPLLHV